MQSNMQERKQFNDFSESKELYEIKVIDYKNCKSYPKFKKELINRLCDIDIKAFYSIVNYLQPKKIVCLGRGAQHITQVFVDRINEIWAEDSPTKDVEVVYEYHPSKQNQGRIDKKLNSRKK